jgi:hypothetical protein
LVLLFQQKRKLPIGFFSLDVGEKATSRKKKGAQGLVVGAPASHPQTCLVDKSKKKEEKKRERLASIFEPFNVLSVAVLSFQMLALHPWLWQVVFLSAALGNTAKQNHPLKIS